MSYTKIDNSIIENKNLSIEAKGIYLIICRYINIPNFQINKTFIKSCTGLGEIRFNKAWMQLKSNGILIQVKTNKNGKFEYEYSLKQEEQPIVSEKKNTNTKQDKQQDNNVVLDGQVSFYKTKKNNFNNFPQRQYNYENLEKALLYGEECQISV